MTKTPKLKTDNVDKERHAMEVLEHEIDAWGKRIGLWGKLTQDHDWFTSPKPKPEKK